MEDNKEDMMDIKLKRVISRKKGARHTLRYGNKRVPWNNCASEMHGKGRLFNRQIPQAWPA